MEFHLGNLGLPQQSFAEMTANSDSLPHCSKGSTAHALSAVETKQQKSPALGVLILQLGRQPGGDKALVQKPGRYSAFMTGHRHYLRSRYLGNTNSTLPRKHCNQAPLLKISKKLNSTGSLHPSPSRLWFWEEKQRHVHREGLLHEDEVHSHQQRPNRQPQVSHLEGRTTSGVGWSPRCIPTPCSQPHI